MTMQNLRDFGRREQFVAFLDGLTDRLGENVQGVCLAYDRYWLALALARMYGPGVPEYWQCHRSQRLLWDAQQHFEHAIYNFRPHDWDSHCASRGYPKGSGPIIIKIIILEPTPNLDLPETWETFPIRYIPEPECEAYAQTINTGDSLGQAVPDTLGTLGGILQHRNGTFYLATAAHVLPKQADVYLPSPTRSKKPTLVAKYSDGKMGVAMAKCNRHLVTPAATVDIALCELNTTVSSLPSPINAGISRWSTAADMTSGDPVAFCGARTHHGSAELTDVNLWRKIRVRGQLLCYADLFVIEPRHKVYVNTRLAKDGDSGAWIIYDGTDPLRAFDGMLVGGAGSRIYCSFAQNIKKWCDDQFGAGNIHLP